ncbi:MAG: hypothetical protein SNJ59_15740 [Aggregatilineales bacterium]
MSLFQERDSALRGLVLGFKLAAAALANPLALTVGLQDEALLDDLASSPLLLGFHPLEGVTIPKAQVAANAPARPRRAGQASEPLPPTRKDTGALAPELNSLAARANAQAAAHAGSAADVQRAPHEMPVFRLSRRPPAENSPSAQRAPAGDAASWPFGSFAPASEASTMQAPPAGEALRSIEALVEAILVGLAANPTAPEAGSEPSRSVAPPAAVPLPTDSRATPMPPLAIAQLDAAARAALAVLAGRANAVLRAPSAPSSLGRPASGLEMAALERLARSAPNAHFSRARSPQARSPQTRSLVIPELDAAVEQPPSAAGIEAASAPLDADALAALVNAALVEQARRYGVDLS